MYTAVRVKNEHRNDVWLAGYPKEQLSRPLLQSHDAIEVMIQKPLVLTALITPNKSEAELLLPSSVLPLQNSWSRGHVHRSERKKKHYSRVTDQSTCLLQEGGHIAVTTEHVHFSQLCSSILREGQYLIK